jgi:hypothetical protein
MVLLTRAAIRIVWVTARAAAPTLFLLAGMWSCGRDYGTPWIPVAPRDSSIISVKPQDTSHPDIKPPGPVLIASVTAADMRLNAGDTKAPAIKLSPDNATSPVYELTSSKPLVADVRAEGIHANLPGTATITVHTLDGSEKTAHFKVTVDAIIDVCLGLCGCGDKGGEGNSDKKPKDCGG